MTRHLSTHINYTYVFNASFEDQSLANPQGICRYNPGSGFAPIAIAESNPSHSLR
jgi:hypothetical protein